MDIQYSLFFNVHYPNTRYLFGGKKVKAVEVKSRTYTYKHMERWDLTIINKVTSNMN